MTIISGGNTNIIGSQVKGDTVKAEIAGDLNIVSLQDTNNYKESQTNWSASASTTGAVSGSYSNQKFESNYKSVDEQAGIFAGSGGFDITVGGNTNLVGGVIASEADAEKNKLDTGTLTWSDIQNKSEYDSSTTGVNVNSGPGVANKDKGMTPNFGGSSDKETSVTGSGISEGTFITRDEDKQKQDLANLNRNPDGNNQALEKPPEKEIVFEKEQAAAIFGEISANVIGELANKKAQEAYDKGDLEEYNKWANGGENRALLHLLAGGLMAEIGGNDFLSGASGALTNEMIHRILERYDEYRTLSDAEKQWIAAFFGGVAAEAISENGLSGAQTAINSEKIINIVLRDIFLLFRMQKMK